MCAHPTTFVFAIGYKFNMAPLEKFGKKEKVSSSHYIFGLDQAVTESHFCCSSLDIFLMEKVRKSCFIWLCRALKVLLNGPSSNLPRK